MNLSPDQHSVYAKMRELAGRQPLLTVSGYAGTGKSTLLGLFAKETRLLCAYLTFTGRASSVLSKKLAEQGVETTALARKTDSGPGGERYYDPRLTEHGGPAYCGTIHRFLYQPVIAPRTEELRGFKKRNALDRKYDLLVVDEASQVGDRILRDLQLFNIPLLCVGDHGQLPPVMDRGDLMREPMLRLEKIHRQAADNPIIRLAATVRETGKLEKIPGITFGERHEVEAHLREAYTPDANLMDLGLICWRNRARIGANRMVRTIRGMPDTPTAGDQLVCLRNGPPIFNGMRGLVESTLPGEHGWDVEAMVDYPDENLHMRHTMCLRQFGRERTFLTVDELQKSGVHVDNMNMAGDLFDYGYALTCHKMQGSQVDHAIVYVDKEHGSEDFKRWTYTAITRAVKKVTVLT